MSRFASFASILLLSSTLGLGCDDDEPTKPPVEPPTPPTGLQFKKLDEAKRLAAVQGAMGEGAGLGFLAAFEALFETSDGSTCPAITDKGTFVEIDAGAGCTAASGAKYKGKIEIENVPFFVPEERVDNAKPMEMRFVGFELDAQKFDGSVWQSSPEPVAEGTFKIDLTYDVTGQGLHIVLEATCTPGGCTSAASSKGELIGEGEFKIAYDSEFDQEGEIVGGSLELSAADKLTVDLGKKDANGCGTYQIDGVDTGKICPPVEE